MAETRFTMPELSIGTSDAIVSQRRMRPSTINCITATESKTFAHRFSENERERYSKPNGGAFFPERITKYSAEFFTNDVLMSGILSIKGRSGWYSWKNRSFVLRGSQLSCHTVDTSGRSGAFISSVEIAGAKIERMPSTQANVYVLSIHSSDTATLILSASDAKTLMDWLTALTVASCAGFLDPNVDHGLLDHTRTTRIILIRHAHYQVPANNVEDPDSPLTEIGMQQADLVGKYLFEYLSRRSVLQRIPIGFPIFHSGVRRTYDTAQRIAHYLTNAENRQGRNVRIQLREDILFREAWPSNPFPTTNRKTLVREKGETIASDCARLRFVYRTMFRHLIPSDLSFQELPLLNQDKSRFVSCFSGPFQGTTRLHDRYRIIVCHANIIRWFICQALGMDPDGVWGKIRYNHCGITEFEVDSVGNVQLGCVNHTNYLTPDLLSESA